jgi:hypothetical protein
VTDPAATDAWYAASGVMLLLSFEPKTCTIPQKGYMLLSPSVPKHRSYYLAQVLPPHRSRVSRGRKRLLVGRRRSFRFRDGWDIPRTGDIHSRWITGGKSGKSQARAGEPLGLADQAAAKAHGYRVRPTSGL